MIRNAAQINEQTPWQEMTVGGEIYEGGTARLVNTGDWRTVTPIYHADKCKHCMLCTPFCPDSSIPVENGKRLDFDLMHCKGCGICAKICPFHAISFEKEGN
jgi:pyruvate ferredoxin oxidoreductase delta subunit